MKNSGSNHPQTSSFVPNTFPDSKVASDDGGDWVMVPDESTKITAAQPDEESPHIFKEESTNVQNTKLPSETITREGTVAGKVNYELDYIIRLKNWSSFLSNFSNDLDMSMGDVVLIVQKERKVQGFLVSWKETDRRVMISLCRCNGRQLGNGR